MHAAAVNDPYFVDCPGRVKKIQELMARENIDVYLGSRLRTLSFVTDAFCPWRSFVVIPPEGLPTAFTFVIDAARIADESWLDEDHVLGYAPIGGMDQITQIAEFITDRLDIRKGRLGIEDGMSNYLPEGNLTHFEYESFRAALPGFELVNAHPIVDAVSLIKDQGTINRFREASRIVDQGHKAVLEAISNGGWQGMTETEIAGIAALAMRKAGSVWEWSFTGGNEIASGYRTGFAGGACTPATTHGLKRGEPLMVDIHAMFKLTLGDHAHNYLIAEATDRQMWHARNFTDIVSRTLEAYRAGVSPVSIAERMMEFAEDRGFAEYMVPGFEHGIGMMGDEWRIGMNDGPLPYWTNPDHAYQENEIVICALQYACPQEGIGFRYENPTLILKDSCEPMSKYPLGVEVVE
ncbi:MAG TPA: M24 family metallopeptidase [Deltaproteobacteria bacterium]|jgi:Xaa-Pro aminopeptidase|nr:M24 family metallopeptidase [Deltaproteobacteria bacterium]HOI07114.1 M24 family metallopeptidase [Deltaproteobacteria bacterium]